MGLNNYIQGMAWHGQARQGGARQGKARQGVWWNYKPPIKLIQLKGGYKKHG